MTRQESGSPTRVLDVAGQILPEKITLCFIVALTKTNPAAILQIGVMSE